MVPRLTALGTGTRAYTQWADTQVRPYARPNRVRVYRISRTAANAGLVSNDSFLVERLKERLEKVQSVEAEVNRALADRVLGLKRPSAADVEPSPSVNGDGMF